MRWAQPKMDRNQIVLFCPTLDETLTDDHPVRLFDMILWARDVIDWQPWEAEYGGPVGQPPIHPKVLASAMLYGMSLGIRSSRKLEDACLNRLDFIWLVEGRTIDHSTFAKFRTKFGRQLKGLFKEVLEVAVKMGLAQLNRIALDGTQVRANSSRHSTASEQTIEKRLKELDAEIERMFAEFDLTDKNEVDLFGESRPTKLPRELADLKSRQERLRKALASVQKKKAAGKKKPKVPVADPDSDIRPNKDGGYAPNYTPVAATAEGGFVAYADVVVDEPEGDQTLVAVDQIEEDFGQKPQEIMADSAFGSGPNLAGLEERGVEALIPQEQRPSPEGNPAIREDPTEPVSAADRGRLPRNCRTKKFDRSAFVYDASTNCYHCPMGRKLPQVRTQQKPRRTGAVTVREYRSAACESCELRGDCVAKNARYRTVSRDEFEELREEMDSRLASDSGRRRYRRRKWLAETPFAMIKEWMGLRRFLLRGKAKVKTEWLWACTAFNLGKLVRGMAALRANRTVAMG